MHLSQEEAVSLLSAWKQAGTPLRVFFSRHGSDQMFQATIREVTALAVKLASASETFNIELLGAEFNGDPNASASSEYEAYLVCELRGGERCYFYVLRTKTSKAI